MQMRPLFLLMLLYSVCGNAQVTTNVFRRVLEIRSGGSNGITGTAFTVDVDNREYLVTAKHMVQKLTEKRAKIEIRTVDNWEPLEVTVYPCDGDVDIAVLIPPRQLTVNFPLEPIGAKHRAFVGQDMLFVGFPYGASAGAVSGRGMNGTYPMAIIKRGTWSGNLEEDGKAPVILLDGYNNPGFSGAPIVFREVGEQEVVFYVIGVISGFFPELTHVVVSSDLKNGEDVSKVDNWRLQKPGQILRDTDSFVPLNTGIVKGYPIDYAMDTIRLHPEGPKVTDDFDSRPR
jgi:hypothetical protein